MSRRLKADLALLVVSFIWGTTFVVVKNALQDTSTLLFLTLRFTVAGLALLLAPVLGVWLSRPGPGLAGRVVARGRNQRTARLSRTATASAVVGLFLFLGYFFQTQGLRWTTASKSAFITGLAVVLVPVITSLASRRFVGWGSMVGVLMALGGLILLTNPGVDASINRGDLWTLACAGAFALHIVLLGHFSRRVPVRALAAGQVLMAALLAAGSFPWAENFFLRLSARVCLAVLLTGLLATALAFFTQTWAQQFTTTTHTALIFSLEPVFAWLTSAVWLGERLGGRNALGALLILAGIVAAELSSRPAPEPLQP